MPSGVRIAGHDRRAVVVGRVELEPHRLHARAARPPERAVSCEGGLEAVVEERGRAPRRARRRATTPGVNGVEPFACARRCAAPSRSRSAAGSSCSLPLPRALGRRRRTRGPDGVISAFCEPVTTTSSPHASVSSGTAPRLETASTTMSAPASAQRGEQRLDVADDPGRRLGVDEERRTRRRSRRARAGGRRARASRPRRTRAARRRSRTRSPSPASARRTRPARRRARARPARAG